MNKRMTLLGLFLLGLLLSASYSPRTALAEIGEAAPTTAGYPAHYFVFEHQPDGTVLPISYQAVQMQAELQSLTQAQLAQALRQPQRNFQQLVVRLESGEGRLVFQDLVSFSPWLRGEFEGRAPGQEIDGHLVAQPSSTFVVRLPQLSASRLVLQDSQLNTLAEFDLAQLVASTPRPSIEESSFINNNILSGSPANRVDLVVLGDGYTAAQSGQFMNDANAVLQTFFSISPLGEYSNYYNLYIVTTASVESGSDHPTYNPTCGYYDPTCCGDPYMQSDPLEGQMVDTAFDSRFCAFAIHRLLVANDGKVYAAAGAAVPDWDQILVLVNDATYGGSGGTSMAVVSMHSQAVLIAQHEYGHSFANLADEYTSLYPGYPPCSDDPSSPSPCESNVTDITVREDIKWNPWILPDTIIPTPNDPYYQGLVGLFEGARYQTNDMYRSGYNCIMRALGQPFCQVPSQSYVLKLYQGGWGMPYDGIDLIEPNSTLPVSTTFTLTHPATQVFSADVLSPVGGPPVVVTWLDNGVPIPGMLTSTLTYTTSADSPGPHEIRLQVEDVTALVNPQMEDGALVDSFEWLVNVSVPFSVQVSAEPTSIYADGVSTSTITATLTDGGVPVEGMLVTFTTSLGSLSPLTATTDVSGVAISTLTSGMLDGTAVVTATTAVGSGSVEVEFMQVEPPVKVEVSADPGVIEANGVSTSTITAIVTDVGLPVEGMVVTFTTSLGSLSPLTATTDASGTAVVTLTAGTFGGTATVVATILGDTDSVDVIFVDIGLPETYLPFIVKH
jgi:hypothetical protein